MVASSYLSYGGALEVVRADDSGLVNSFCRIQHLTVKIRSVEHYKALGYDENPRSNVTVAARNPGTWGDDIRVGIIDSKADQIIKIPHQMYPLFCNLMQSAVGNAGQQLAIKHFLQQ